MRRSLLIACVVGLSGTPLAGQSPAGLAGVWEVIDVSTSANPSPKPQSGYYIFTRKFMSVSRETQSTPRPQINNASATADELRARLRFSAATGPYEVKGDEVHFTRTVGLGSVPGTKAIIFFRLAGDTLWLTQKTNGDEVIPESEREVRRLKRVE